MRTPTGTIPAPISKGLHKLYATALSAGNYAPEWRDRAFASLLEVSDLALALYASCKAEVATQPSPAPTPPPPAPSPKMTVKEMDRDWRARMNAFKAANRR